MMFTILTAAAGLALLYFGGEYLVRGASALALRIGISPLTVGLTVVALGTSAPELVVSLGAALTGSDDIAFGNVVGSNIANTALVLGVAALVRPLQVDAKVVRLDSPIMVAAALALLLFLRDGVLSAAEGALSLLALGAYVGFTLWEAGRDSAAVRDEFSAVARPSKRGIALDLAFVALGICGLLAGGRMLVSAAVEIATSYGVSEAVIGLTVVAVGTSLPELAASVVATLRGQGDIAVGNVVGSCIFNGFGILGVTAVVHPLAQGGVTHVDLGVMLALAAVVPMFLFTRLNVSRTEGAFLAACYAFYMAHLFAQTG